MITITRDGNGYKVKLSAPGTGWKSTTVKAQNINEVNLAVSHFYGEGELKHISGSRSDDCPLCRKVQDKA